jgi:hypothetical protein
MRANKKQKTKNFLMLSEELASLKCIEKDD